MTQNMKRFAALFLAAALIGAIATGCRSSKRQGCPTFNSIDLQIQQSDFLNG
jgi:predicted component of type VI protein secretion system